MARPTSRIEFADAHLLTDAASWVHDPDKELADGCALRHTLLQQLSPQQSTLTAYAIGDTWLSRYVPSSGFTGENYLFDGSDLIDRVGKNKAFQAGSLVVSRNRGSTMKVKSVLMEEEGGTTQSYGHINIGTYSGTLDEFELPEADTVHIASVPAYDWMWACHLVSTYSKLSNDKELRHAMFMTHCDPGDFVNQMGVIGPEPDGANGAAFVYMGMDCTLHEKFPNFCVWGRHLKAIASVGRTGTVEIYLDSLVEPTSVTIQGSEGMVKTPLYDKYTTRYLQEMGMYYFFPTEERSYEWRGHRTFTLDYLANCFQIQKPKANATRHDILLDSTDTGLSISKQSDSAKSEESKVEVHPTKLDCLEEAWEPIIVNYTYLDLALQVTQKYNALVESESEGQTRMTLVELQQIFVPATNRWGLLIKPEGGALVLALNVIHPSRYA